MMTKRQLGIFVAIAGLTAGAVTIGVDLAGAGEWSGFGPLQQAGLGAGLLLLVVGALLFRLGDRPA
jgi:hypothetical protein